MPLGPVDDHAPEEHIREGWEMRKDGKEDLKKSSEGARSC
jgi:hypothetical protein